MEDYPMFGAKARARLTAVSDRNAQNLTPSAVPSEITKEFGERMFQYFPGERRTLGDREYSQYVPADIVTKMVRGKKPQS